MLQDVYNQVKEEDFSENTSKILNRYQSYPPSLAMLMDKSKKSSTLIKNSTVECFKDYKCNLPKKEIKNFIDSKNKLTETFTESAKAEADKNS